MIVFMELNGNLLKNGKVFLVAKGGMKTDWNRTINWKDANIV